MNLVELTKTEEAIADVRVTLYEISKKFNVRHYDLKRDFNKIVKSLKDDELLTTINFVAKDITIITGKGKKEEIETYDMNLKTMIWFVSKFNHELRLRIVNYAFDKLEDDYMRNIKELEYKLSLKPKVVAVNTSKVNRRLRHEELMKLVKDGLLSYEKSIITKYKYGVTKLGSDLGYYKDNGIIKHKEQ